MSKTCLNRILVQYALQIGDYDSLLRSLNVLIRSTCTRCYMEVKNYTGNMSTKLQ